jgi:hypothetical protein
VNRLKPFVSLMVLTLWASCTIHCQIEPLTHSETSACCNETGGESNQTPAQDGHCICSWVKSGGYISEKSVVPLPLPIGHPLFTLPAYLEIPMPDPCASELTFSPPDLLTSWHISNRAAPLPRAPSFVS